MKLADLNTHKIEGIARMGNKPFSVPLFSHIEGNLWQGGCPVGEAPNEFAFIINLYPWEPYRVEPYQTVFIHTLYDSHTVPDPRLLDYLAELVNDCSKQALTLVHCQAGLNRSALVAALALVKRGAKPSEAIALLRNKRSEAVLCNEYFAKWLESL